MAGRLSIFGCGALIDRSIGFVTLAGGPLNCLNVQGAAPNTNQAPGVQPAAAPMPGYQYVQVPVYNVWTDPNVVGQLAVVVERANLVKNYGLTNMNPYCRLRVGHNMSNTRIAEGAGKV